MAIYDYMAVQPGNVRYGNIPFAVAGQIVDLYFHEIVSANVKTADIEFGQPVIQNADGTVSVATDGTGGVLFGIAVRELTREMDVRGALAVTKYLVGNVAGIMRKGHINVLLASDSVGSAAFGGAVYFTAGKWYGSSVGTGALTLVAVPGVTFNGIGVAGEVVEVRMA